MLIYDNSIKIGSRVKLLSDQKLFNITFTKGHEFIVYGEDPIRGFDLIDDEGNKMNECR